ncbi:MAG: hypothetical protein JW814_03725 [Candidatus Krumholzibacteriota bacterium]|nr:hypothetical protein [Candidatus Krumholzibacteriota bacterium]
MKAIFLKLIITFVIVSLFPFSLYSADMKSRETLGIRIGGVFSPGKLDHSFGKGSELEIHFVEGLGSWFGLGFSLSTHYFGRSLDRELDLDYTGLNRSIKLEIYSLTTCFESYFDLGQRLVFGTETGAGLYTSSAVIVSGFYEGRITRNDPGLYAGLKLYYRITEGGLGAEMAFKYHHIYSGSDRSHVIYAYTGETEADFFQLTIGFNFFTR